MPKLCEYLNCRNRATYGLTRSCPLRCYTHKEHMQITNKLCKCGKANPCFNEPYEKTPICCASCKTITMIDVKNKKCKCNKSPHFNY